MSKLLPILFCAAILATWLTQFTKCSSAYPRINLRRPPTTTTVTQAELPSPVFVASLEQSINLTDGLMLSFSERNPRSKRISMSIDQICNLVPSEWQQTKAYLTAFSTNGLDILSISWIQRCQGEQRQRQPPFICLDLTETTIPALLPSPYMADSTEQKYLLTANVSPKFYCSSTPYPPATSTLPGALNTTRSLIITIDIIRTNQNTTIKYKQTMRKIVYSIEGNIGSGKTTLLQMLKHKMPGIVVSPEPIGDWQRVSKYNLLETYYAEPHRWAYTFQNYALLTRMNQLHRLIKQQPANSPLLFSERSVVADKQIFAKLLHEEGKISELEYQLYLKVFDDLHHLHTPPPIFRHIYLRTDPAICRERIRKRARNQQANLPLSYLTKIHELHEEWLGKGFVLQGTRQFQTCQETLKEMIQKIQAEITESPKTIDPHSYNPALI